MAIFEITEGAPRQGKTIYTMRIFFFLLERNAKWEKKSGKKRKIALNIKLSEEVEEKYGDWIIYWSDPSEVVKLRDCDLIWDEIATELDSRNFANLSVELKRFLSQYRKRGIDIFANTQDFSMIDYRARLMVTHVRSLSKLMGSPDISTTKPKPKRIWGLVMMRDMINWKADDLKIREYDLIPGFFWITKELAAAYDTTQDIKVGKPAPLGHKVLVCENQHDPVHPCDFCKIVHS